ncbi:unnamed protein product [Cladocopium goreaui]|uniref:Uncharacterized protein n=1 Tax=Cladocopium goreaui TaxID=2562237 RepID=A0A9P1GJF8_9DINO|nr:unnamed protein product [Cladocopium goreaui]
MDPSLISAPVPSGRAESPFSAENSPHVAPARRRQASSPVRLSGCRHQLHVSAGGGPIWRNASQGSQCTPPSQRPPPTEACFSESTSNLRPRMDSAMTFGGSRMDGDTSLAFSSIGGPSRSLRPPPMGSIVPSREAAPPAVSPSPRRVDVRARRICRLRGQFPHSRCNSCRVSPWDQLLWQMGPLHHKAWCRAQVPYSIYRFHRRDPFHHTTFRHRAPRIPQGSIAPQNFPPQGSIAPQSFPPQGSIAPRMPPHGSIAPQNFPPQGSIAPQSFPPQGSIAPRMPPQGSIAPQNFPPQGSIAPQSFPPQGSIAPRMPPQGSISPQNFPPQGSIAPQSFPPQGSIAPRMPPQGSIAPQNFPPQGSIAPQSFPPQGSIAPRMPPQGSIAPQNFPPQGSIAPQNFPPQGSLTIPPTGSFTPPGGATPQFRPPTAA